MQLFKQLFKYYFFMMIIFFVSRAILLILYFDRFKDDNLNYYLSFLYGLKMDTMSGSFLLIIPMFLLTLSPNFLKNIVHVILKYYFLVIFSVVLYIEIATYPFLQFYDVRPNYLFVEYLEYPKEVFGMIIADYKMAILVSIIVIGGFVWAYLKNYKNTFLEIFEVHYIKRVLLFVPLFLLLFIGVRSSFGHRGANISDAMYSSNRILNEITKNSLYSIAYAIYSNKKHSTKDIAKRYGKIDINEAISRVQKRLNIQNADKKYILKRFVKTHFKKDKTKNLVIFLQESLGYQFVKAVGGEDGITPNFNLLAKQGLLFTNLHSNGTRSIRGIAGIVAGNFSIPGKGILKRNKSQKDYWTIASLLKPLGYETSFIYGGESRFDNMKGWFLGNGFDKIIDEPKFKNPTFVGTWGVCDEEVIKRANQEYKKLYSSGKKFASVIFSTSNHSPFDFPDDKIKLLPNIPKKSVKNAIKYADFAIGEFIRLAKKESYYKDTIFVIVADHNVRVYGDDIVPVDMFHIPAIILGDDIPSQIYDKISTQPDILATALDLIGVSGDMPIMGHSIYSNNKQNLSLMQFNDRYALRVDNKIAVLRPNKKPLTFLYQNKHLIPTKEDIQLQKDLLAFVTVLNYVYQKRLYK
jgi:phosphoglycerol transferase MdoB-like AlkP superfamily enzyme